MNIDFTPPSPNLIPEPVYLSIVSDVTQALNSLVTVGDEFIVNDTIWRKRATKNNRSTLNPIVVNQADFIPKGIERCLENQLGWETQKSLTLPGEDQDLNQVFDAYKGFSSSGFGLVDLESETRVLHDYLEANGPIDLVKFAHGLSVNYRHRRCFLLGSDYQPYRNHFSLWENTEIRVAIEIETGNIASSFRSIHKMTALFAAGQIDVGLLITSSRKRGGATSIWPSSNRNGSIQELNMRGAFANLPFPLIRVGFMPDGLCRTAPYLNSDGSLYHIEPLTTVTIDNVTYTQGHTAIHGDIYTRVLRDATDSSGGLPGT